MPTKKIIALKGRKVSNSILNARRKEVKKLQLLRKRQEINSLKLIKTELKKSTRLKQFNKNRACA